MPPLPRQRRPGHNPVKIMTRSIRAAGDGSFRAPATITPHRKGELKLVNANCPVREELEGDTVYIELGDYGQRLAYVAYPETNEPYAVVHTAGDFPTPKKWETKRRFENVIKPRCKTWSANAQERQLLKMARDGAYDTQAEDAGFDSPISYVLYQIEQGSKEQTTDVPASAGRADA